MTKQPLPQRISAGWSRRQTLTAMAAATVPGALTAPVKATTLPHALTEICLGAVASAPQERLGQAWAADRSLHDIAFALQRRIAPQRPRGWHAALLEAGRRDIAAGDFVTVLGESMMHTEAELLALGAALLKNS